ncbi:MAG: RecQ family ATP-dependent DNA helicase, partial [Proteobacteria bacterium]|nr:RecQ family ATP-dependent DNA helicase [Pseudomonadota bacterium]
PAILLPHLTLVVSPLLALMKDQVDFLKSHNIPAASIDSTQSREESNEIIQGVKTGQIKILMISVERLKNERFREFIKQITISLLVIDEAHCISEWGHNFRPDYIKLPDYQKQFNIKQVLLLTATATANVIEDMSREFSIDKEHIITTGFYRKNLNIIVNPSIKSDKLNFLGHYLNSHQGQATIVYVTLQKTAENICNWLRQNGVIAEAYHAGLKNDLREQIQERFMNSDNHCIIATIAFGMGIDKNNIRHVIHYDLPKSIENYAQEIGRAGRDGESSNCLLLANENGINILENFVYGDTPELSGIKIVLNEIKQTSNIWEVLSNPLSSQSNIRLLALKTLLVYLEIKGIIQSKYSYYAEYKFKFLISENDIIQKFKGERQVFIQAVFQHSHKAKIWNTLDFEQLLKNYPTDRQRVIIALDYLQENGWIILENKQMTDVYQVLNNQFDINILATELYEKFKHKEQAQIQRIKEMLTLFQSSHCLSKQLSHYFGDTQLTENCGHCSVCQGNYQIWPEAIENLSINPVELRLMTSKLNDAIMSQYAQPASIDLCCRYLCGITTPWLTKVRARKLGDFGRYEHYGYAEVYRVLGAKEQQ